jgi:hypothetical protein
MSIVIHEKVRPQFATGIPLADRSGGVTDELTPGRSPRSPKHGVGPLLQAWAIHLEVSRWLTATPTIRTLKGLFALNWGT